MENSMRMFVWHAQLGPRLISRLSQAEFSSRKSDFKTAIEGKPHSLTDLYGMDIKDVSIMRDLMKPVLGNLPNILESIAQDYDRTAPGVEGDAMRLAALAEFCVAYDRSAAEVGALHDLECSPSCEWVKRNRLRMAGRSA